MAVMVEQRSFRPFKSSEEYLFAMKEDLAEWLNNLYPDLYINVNNFMDRLDTGVALCEHANNVRRYAEEYVTRRQAAGKTNVHSIATSALRLQPIRSFPGAKAGTFFARDNVSNFITWCRHGLGVFECLLFETDDLIMRKNEKHVILCLLEVARRAAKLGMPAPMLVHLEVEIDREIAADKRKLRFGGCQDYYEQVSEEDSDLSDGEDLVEYGPIPQIVTNDLKSLDEMVRDEVEKCQCPTQFPMIRVSEGKYRIGDTKVLIFVRILRSHVMVRVGGGWDTLSHYLDKHDPCRCRTAHRAPVSSRLLGIKSGGPALELTHAQIHYDRSPPRTRRSSTSSNSSNGGSSYTPAVPLSSVKISLRSTSNLSPNLSNAERRSRSPTPRLKKTHHTLAAEQSRVVRSRSPTPEPVLCIRSRSGTPTSKKNTADKRVHSFITTNKDLTMHFSGDGNVIPRNKSSSTDHRSRHNSMAASRVLSAELVKQVSEELVNRADSIREKYSEMEVTNIVEGKRRCIETSGVDCSSTHRVSENFKGTNQYHLVNGRPIDKVRRSPSPCVERSGVDTSPACSVSDNFFSASQYQHYSNNNHRRSVSPYPERTTSASTLRKHSSKEKSGIDTTSVSKVSENLVKSSRSRKSSASVNDLDLITKKEQNDSGSEVSDEGYKSLGMATTPPGNAHQTAIPPLTGSPSRIQRPPRSRSAGRQNSPSPQQSPFRRNTKVNQSARQSPTHHAIKQTSPQQSARNYNTWNSSHTNFKKRPTISENTFCQQVAKIMQEYAAMVPSPRKDSKPDSRISTRIPAPVPAPRT